MAGLITYFSVWMICCIQVKLHLSFYDYVVAFLSCILYLFKPLCGVCYLIVPIFHPQPPKQVEQVGEHLLTPFGDRETKDKKGTEVTGLPTGSFSKGTFIDFQT